jgi:hypothetical protein
VQCVGGLLYRLMTFAQRGKGESRQKTSEYLKEDVRPMLLCWANVRRALRPHSPGPHRYGA